MSDVTIYDALGWLDPLPTDIDLSHFVLEDDLFKFDWDLAIWWNEDLAEAARNLALNRRIDMGYVVLREGMADSLSSNVPDDNLERFKEIAARVPRGHVRVADHFQRATGHLIKSNGDRSGKPVMIYDAGTGTWKAEGSELANGMTASAVLDWAIEQFTRAMHRAIDILEYMAVVVETALTPVAVVDEDNPTAQEQRALAARAAYVASLKDAYKEAHKMARDMGRKEQGRVRSMVKQRVGVAQTAWDSQTKWLVLRDGMIDLEATYETGVKKKVPFSPLAMSTMSLDVGLDDSVRNAGVSEWQRGVEKVLPDPEVRKYLQKRFGGALLGSPARVDKSMVWQYGVGDTAKSTIQECIAGKRGVFAPYSYAASSDVLMKRNGANPAAERFIAYARGKRFVIMSEINAGDRMDRGVFTSLTGGDTVEGTAKFANAVSYEFTATIFMASNDAPTYPPGDTTFVQRIHVVPFTHKLWQQTKNPEEWAHATEEHRADPGWRDRVLSSPQERAAILGWVLDGLILLKQEGFGALPAAMIEARDEFSEGADPIRDLVDSLLGHTEDSSPALYIYTDEQWEAAGFSEGEGATPSEVSDAINARSRLLGVTKFGDDKLSNTYMTAVRKVLEERGGSYKNARVRTEDGGQKQAKRWCRIKVVAAPAVPSGGGLAALSRQYG